MRLRSGTACYANHHARADADTHPNSYSHSNAGANPDA